MNLKLSSTPLIDGVRISFLTMIFAVIVQVILNLLVLGPTTGDYTFDNDFFLFVLITPLLETVISFLIIKIVSSFLNDNGACVCLGMIWAVLHSAGSEILWVDLGWMAIALFSFFLYGKMYFKYRNKSLKFLILIVTFPHSLHNLYVYILSSYASRIL